MSTDNPVTTPLLQHALTKLIEDDFSLSFVDEESVLYNLYERTQFWCRRVQYVADTKPWILFNPDVAEFTAQLLALWLSRKTVWLPGDNLPMTQQRLAQHTEHALGEWDGALSESSDEHQCTVLNYLIPENEDAALVVFTSGSTGEPQPIKKSFLQLNAELHAHQKIFPFAVGSTLVSTVTHQHIYGLLFRVLRPLVEGVRVVRRLCHFPEDLLKVLQHNADVTLITSPSHLERIPDAAQWRSVAAHVTRIFSSASPLKRETSLVIQQLFQASVIEIYGSSETGGIAWRTQTCDHDALWQPLPGVCVRANAEQQLWLSSLHLGHLNWVEQSDRIEQLGERFRLLGRQDRIVKVEGKRVSLTGIERSLVAMPEVEAASSLVLQSHRESVVVVLVLSAAGRVKLSQIGQPDFYKVLKGRLKDQFEAVVLPRRWRIVHELPRNLQGKVTQQALIALFDERTEHDACQKMTIRPKLPRVLSSDTCDQEITLQLSIPTDLLYFDGHFDEIPVLPGVVQVHWAQHYARERLNVEGQFKGLEKIKFQQLLQPESEVTLVLRFDSRTRKLSFQYEHQGVSYSSGKICYG